MIARGQLMLPVVNEARRYKASPDCTIGRMEGCCRTSTPLCVLLALIDETASYEDDLRWYSVPLNV